MKPEGVLLLTVGIFLGIFQVSSFPNNADSGYTRLQLPRGGKTNGNSAQYATHRPYKADFDLLRVSERSQELEMPLIQNNDIGGDGDDTAALQVLLSDPTLRSRRKRQLHSQDHFPNGFQLCLPYFNMNPLCRQLFVGAQQPQQATSHSTQAFSVAHAGQRGTIIAVPTSSPAFYLPSSSSLSHPNALRVSPAGTANFGRNELAILNNYYQQQQPPQNPALQVGVFQAPVPNQRQRPQYDGIHVKYPYPYPPTLDVAPQSPAAPQPASGSQPGQTTEYPMETPAAGTTLVPEQVQEGGQQDTESSAPVGSFPDSAASQQQGQQSQQQEATTEASQITEASNTQSSQDQQSDPSFTQQIHHQEFVMQKRLREYEEELRRLRAQLEQSNLQIVSYEQENSMFKDQYQRSEEANVKLRDRVLQLENTNQHLQDQNGQLQQTNNEQRQQINTLKASQKDSKEQLAQFQNQMQPLSLEIQKHRKEIEDFLIRIRNLGEANETCHKALKLYQLKINYIQEQQQQKKDKNGKPEKYEKQEVQDDELDPELSRMDAEIASLLKKGSEVASALQNLPQPPKSEPSGQNDNPAIPESPVPAKAAAAEQDASPSQLVEVKNESEFPGEAVQIPQRAQQEPEQKTVATAEEVARAPEWEKPAGF